MKRIKLDEIDKKVPFEVPEGYFSTLTSQIQDRIQEKPKKQWIPAGQLKWALSGAFSLAIILTVIFYPSTEKLNAEQMLAEVSDEALIEYLDFAEFTTNDIIDGLGEDELNSLWEDSSLESLDLEDLNYEDIFIDYDLDKM